MALDTVERRRYAMEQVQASSRIEGYVHTADDLADAERYIRGEVSIEDLRKANLARALEAVRLAGEVPPVLGP